jgi:nicotinamidase-related amidase
LAPVAAATGGRYPVGSESQNVEHPMAENPSPLPRSPELMSRDDTALLVVDMQEKLLPHIAQHQRIIWNIARLIDGAHLLGVEVAATEQYPRGLGATVPVLAERIGQIPDKLAFSCGECGEVFQRLAEAGRQKILVSGVETHVCVLQSVLDLLHDGFRVYVAVDAVGSRCALDYQTALRRIESAGATLTTVESALFEWCAVAGTPEFKQISALVRQTSPE